MQQSERASGLTVSRCLTNTCAACVLWAATAIGLSAQTFTRLDSFDNTGGAFPYAGLVQATDGNLYGTTAGGGADGTCGFFGSDYGCGTVFKITPEGALTTIYNFCSQSNCSDGSYPEAGLIEAGDGNFYGTTSGGGTQGSGTVFRITSGGTLTTLYSFCSQTDCADGADPTAGLVQATNGALYGTTLQGGIDSCTPLYSGCGTLFQITLTGALTTLYTFCSQDDCTDGANPAAGLTQGTDGNLYGTTEFGGANFYACGEGVIGCGTVFKLAPSGTLTTLHSFDSTDGALPLGGMVQATDGDFFGTTLEGGANDSCSNPGCGTIFKITPSGTLSPLHRFKLSDGANPQAGLIQATDTDVYGTTGAGTGTVFKMTLGGRFTTLFSFTTVDGVSPLGALVQDTNGALYGTTVTGGTTTACDGGGCGTVFTLSEGLGPFVETYPTSAKVGKPINVLGTNLSGATSVTFNGVAASFTVASSSLITTSVPQGATTGYVEVTTPQRTLKSNVPFRVIR